MDPAKPGPSGAGKPFSQSSAASDDYFELSTDQSPEPASKRKIKTPNNGFQTTKSKRKKNKGTPTPPKPAPIPLFNTYDSLSEDDDTDAGGKTDKTDKTDFTNDTDSHEEFYITKKKNNTKIPAIVVHDRANNITKTMEILKKSNIEEYNIKYTSNNINIYVNNPEHHKILVQQLDLGKSKFHTYTLNQNKNHAFVLRGLDQDPAVDEVKSALKDKGCAIINAFKLKKTARPLFLIITSMDTKLKDLQNKIKSILHTRITWEIRRNNRLITQCHICQRWGHATSNCHLEPRCLKCAENHLTHTCTKTPDTPAKCANCDGDHPANSTTCNIYKTKIEQINNNKNKNKSQKTTGFVPAPAPANNIWQQRMEQQQQQLQQQHPHQSHQQQPQYFSYLQQPQQQLHPQQQSYQQQSNQQHQPQQQSHQQQSHQQQSYQQQPHQQQTSSQQQQTTQQQTHQQQRQQPQQQQHQQLQQQQQPNQLQQTHPEQQHTPSSITMQPSASGPHSHSSIIPDNREVKNQLHNTSKQNATDVVSLFQIPWSPRINLSELVRAVRDLSHLLNDAKDSQDALGLYLDFVASIGDYKIVRE